MQQWYNQNCSLLESDDVGQIHGNWCGPDWTGGQNVSAEDYQGSWNYPAIDQLDAACAQHDRDCSQGGCSKAGDTRLIKAAEARILPFLDQVKLEVEYTTLILRGKVKSTRARWIQRRLDESSTAGLIATGISIVRPFRRR